MKGNQFAINSILFIICFPLLAISQINDSLQILCDSIRVVNDTSDANFKHLSRSRSYNMQMLKDTLTIEIEKIDSLIWSDDPRDHRASAVIYKMNVNDIGEMSYSSKSKELYGIKWTESYIEFSALRFYTLFKQIFDHTVTTETDMVKIPVISQRDTAHFKQIVHLLNNHIDIENNYIPPSCKSEDILLEGKNNKKITAIELNNLEKPIALNGSQDLEQEIHQILIGYIEQENIKKIFGIIYINKNDQLEHFHSEQNKMYNYLNTLDTIPSAFKVMRETAYFKITDEQKDHIKKVLEKQKWETGSCGKQKVNSYFDFYIENKN